MTLVLTSNIIIIILLLRPTTGDLFQFSISIFFRFILKLNEPRWSSNSCTHTYYIYYCCKLYTQFGFVKYDNREMLTVLLCVLIMEFIMFIDTLNVHPYCWLYSCQCAFYYTLIFVIIANQIISIANVGKYLRSIVQWQHNNK